MKLSGVEISQIYESIFSKDFFNLCFMFNTNRDKISIKEYIKICQDYPLEALQNFSQSRNDEKIKLKNNAKKLEKYISVLNTYNDAMKSKDEIEYPVKKVLLALREYIIYVNLENQKSIKKIDIRLQALRSILKNKKADTAKQHKIKQENPEGTLRCILKDKKTDIAKQEDFEETLCSPESRLAPSSPYHSEHNSLADLIKDFNKNNPTEIEDIKSEVLQLRDEINQLRNIVHNMCISIRELKKAGT